ncbi:hypothetical protein P3TCK_22605 [Photobacterium profundum 3TCK]|uniref:Uncharacterized protein n=1 Tax=Photobacterium profundum 3TCK TaxID=314280 RepID=Q1Z2F1_9GAMM|nr:hypothetical protein P3TCK_22605 [Photobacterium profundum 3TCK]
MPDVDDEGVDVEQPAKAIRMAIGNVVRIHGCVMQIPLHVRLK